jgi:hypothetical protein
LPFIRILFSTLSLPVDRDARIGANGRAFLAGDAVLVTDGNGVLPSFRVKVTDDLDHIARTLGNAQFASLAEFAVDFDVRTHVINLQGKTDAGVPAASIRILLEMEGKD